MESSSKNARRSLLPLFIIILYLILVNVMEAKSIREKVTQPCGYDSITILKPGNITLCIDCLSCPPGWEPSTPCGETVIFLIRMKPIHCRRCLEGTFSATFLSRSPCRPCKTCNNGKVIRNCTSRSDTVCQSCPSGFYFTSEFSSCLPCSRCCGDGKDQSIDDCITQGSQHHCSFHSHNRCHGNVRNETDGNETRIERRIIEPTNHSRVPIATTFATFQYIFPSKTTFLQKETWNINLNLLLLAVILMIFIAGISIFVAMKRSTRKKGKLYRCFPTRLSKHKCLSDTCNQSDDWEDWAKHDVINSTYLFKCGVTVRNDKSSRLDGTKDLVVEMIDSLSSYPKVLETDQMFISPIFKFYSQGTQFEKPVRVSLPHSALFKPQDPNWDIEVVYVDEREGKNAKWKKVESEIDINWKEVNFFTKTLLTYAVVGKPRKSAKKRMQFAVFSMKKMISDRFEMALYLLDESSLQRILKVNKSRGWTMIGSLYAVFVDCCQSVNITVRVDELLEPWTLIGLKPETISSQMLADSYFNIPQYQAIFRRSKRSAQKFFCNFRVDIGGSEIIIPVVTFVPEELLCVFVDVHNEDPSINAKQALLRDLSYDINYELCRKLDVPARGLGQWRQLGRLLGVTEDVILACSHEYASIDGSPSKLLMEYICTIRPKITVGELAKCLEELGRVDVLSVLSKVK